MAKKTHQNTGGRIERAQPAYVGGRHAGTNNRNSAPPPAPRRKKKKRPLRAFLITLAAMALVVVLGIGALTLYLNRFTNPGAAGIISAEHYTPKEYQGDVLNILFVGVYREPGTNYPEGLGLTDVILYVNYDIKNNKMNMLQIPRDSYVGKIQGSDGKINSLMVTGSDKDNPINNLVSCIVDQYKLPVDRYVCLDMDGLKEIIDVFGAIRVYVSKPMNYDGSSLEQSWQWLDSDSVEFFVRNRHGTGFKRADIDRLDNQRHFYSAIFRRFLQLTPSEITKLLPLFETYCNTDIKTNDLYDLAFTALKLQTENIMICRVPGATSSGDWSTEAILGMKTAFVVDINGRGTEEEPGVATLLNQYFRTYGEQVPASELNVPVVEIPSYVALYPVNVQYMGALQEDEGGADVPVEPGA